MDTSTDLPADAADAAVGITTASVSPTRQAYLRFKQHRAAVVSVFVMAVFILFILLSPVTARYGVNQPIFQATPERPNTFLTPHGAAWFGTDDIGRDMFSRLIYGARVSLLLATFASLIGIAIGIIVGALAGLVGGWLDDIMMRITDIFLSFPFLVSLVVTRAFMGELTWLRPVVGKISSVRFLVFLFAFFGWQVTARLVRSQVVSLKEREFVEAARAVGASRRHLIVRHFLPNSVGPLLVSLSFSIVGVISGEATLALFGFGPELSDGTSLGLLVGDARQHVIGGRWWLVLFPCAVLLVITLAVSFIGDGLRDATDPKASQGRA